MNAQKNSYNEGFMTPDQLFNVLTGKSCRDHEGKQLPPNRFFTTSFPQLDSRLMDMEEFGAIVSMS